MSDYDQNEKDLAEAEAFVSRHPRIVLEGIYIAGLHAERARSAELIEAQRHCAGTSVEGVSPTSVSQGDIKVRKSESQVYRLRQFLMWLHDRIDEMPETGKVLLKEQILREIAESETHLDSEPDKS